MVQQTSVTKEPVPRFCDPLLLNLGLSKPRVFHYPRSNCGLSLSLLSSRLVLENGIHLLQGTAIGLGDKEVHPDKGNAAKATEEHIGPEADVLDHRRCDQPLESQLYMR